LEATAMSSPIFLNRNKDIKPKDVVLAANSGEIRQRRNNSKVRDLVKINLTRFKEATTKEDKSRIVLRIVRGITGKKHGGR
jgi:hypothetical protein